MMGWPVGLAERLALFGLLAQRAQAPGAHPDLARLAIDQRRHLLDVRTPASIGAPLRMAHIVTKLAPLATDLTYSHVSDPLSLSQSAILGEFTHVVTHR
jgi:hypothetical protein